MEPFFRMTARAPWISILLVLAVSLVFGWLAASGFRVETDLDEYMPKDHPAFAFSDQAEEWFGIDDGVLVALHHPEGIYRPGTLAKVRELTRALEALPQIGAGEVMSLAAAENITGSDWGLEVEPFYEAVPRTPAELAGLREKVRSNPMIGERLVSADERSTLVIARLSGEKLTDPLYRSIRELERRFEGPEEIFVAGRPIVEGELAELGPRDMKRMGPLVLLAIAAVLRVVLRSVRDTLLSLAVVALSVVWTFGLMALAGIPVYAVSTMIPVMLVAIGVAYSIHIFNSAALYRGAHPEVTPGELARRAVADITRPVVMTALTTAVGFLSLLTSQVYPVKYFGLFTAFGVLSAMVLALTLLPAGFVLFGMPKPRGATRRAAGRRRAGLRPAGAPPPAAGPEGQAPSIGAARAAEGIRRGGTAVWAVTGAVVVWMAFSIPSVWIDSSFLSNFERDSEIARTDAFVNANFGGTSTLNVILQSGEPDTFKRPEVLRRVAAVQRDLEAHPRVGGTFALTDYLRRMHQVMHADDPAFDDIPDSQELVAQYLLLYEMSGDPDNLAGVVDYEYRSANLTAQLKSDGSRLMREAIAAVSAHEPALAELGVEVRYAGSGYKALVFSELILEGQIKSLFLSLAIVIGLLALMFRSFRVGLIGAIPIGLTTLVNFGVMGLLGIPLGASTALISSIAVGIGIDYAIHFIERYREYAGVTRDADRAAALTMHHTGRAILFNAAVVALGFAVLLFSVFPPNRQVGGLVALNMIASFLGTVTVLYLVLYRGRIFLPKTRTRFQEEKHA